MSPTPRLLLTAILAFTVPGCASISVEKVPHPPSYSLQAECTGDPTAPCWNELQRSADAIEGARYYLPRPYIVVKQEYPIAGATYFVFGRIDQGGRVVEIGEVPEALRGILPPDGVLPIDQIRDGMTPMRDAPSLLTQEAAPADDEAAGETKDEKAKEAAKPKLRPDSEKFLEGSTVQPNDVSGRDALITLTAKIKKEAFAEGKLGSGTVLTGKLYLVQIKEGSHVVDNLVEVKKVSIQGDAGENRTLVGLVVGKEVPSHASIGVGVKTAEEENLILHTAGADIHSSFAAVPESPKEQGKKEDEAKESEKKVESAKATTSGDPTTDPLTKLSSLFDVLLLPDYSEQYAIEVRSGVFSASAALGFENGWMAEKLNFDIDNSELGTFLIDSAEALVTQGLSEVFGTLEAVEEGMAQDSADETLSQESESLGDQQVLRVVLRVDHLELASPGLYPILKATEQTCGWAPSVLTEPCGPRIHYDRTRTLTVISVVDIEPEPAAGGQTGCDREAIVRDVVRGRHGAELASKVKIREDELASGEIVLVLPAGALTDEQQNALMDELNSVLPATPGCTATVSSIHKEGQ